MFENQISKKLKQNSKANFDTIKCKQIVNTHTHTQKVTLRHYKLAGGLC